MSFYKIDDVLIRLMSWLILKVASAEAAVQEPAMQEVQSMPMMFNPAQFSQLQQHDQQSMSFNAPPQSGTAGGGPLRYGGRRTYPKK